MNLSAREDPGGKATKFQKEWVIDHRVKMAIPSPAGGFVSTPPLAIRKGDFVDVAATFSIVARRGKYVNATEVTLCPVEVVRLWSAAEASVSRTQYLLRNVLILILRRFCEAQTTRMVNKPRCRFWTPDRASALGMGRKISLTWCNAFYHARQRNHASKNMFVWSM